jgi:methylenetetrahydrofolate dehydrogenase (NADP+)/methenyltetrahydrofolate cyclohydrolase
MTRIIDGKKIAADIIERLKKLPRPSKALAAVYVGKSRASESFLRQKEKIAKELGIDFRVYKFDESLSQDRLRREVGKISKQGIVGGAIIQLPLPQKFSRQPILNAIQPEKDVDCLTETMLGKFYTGRSPIVLPSVGAAEEILKTLSLKLEVSKVAVIGAGFLVGKPIASWLMGKARDVYVLRSGSDFNILKQADLVISGMGEAGLIKAEMLKENATIIDFGTSYFDGKIRGDFDDESLKAKYLKIKTINYTPTPGGTGPIVVAKLFENFYKLCGLNFKS